MSWVCKKGDLISSYMIVNHSVTQVDGMFTQAKTNQIFIWGEHFLQDQQCITWFQAR